MRSQLLISLYHLWPFFLLHFSRQHNAMMTMKGFFFYHNPDTITLFSGLSGSLTTLLIDHLSTSLNQSNRCGLYIWLLGIVTPHLWLLTSFQYFSCPGGCTPHGPCLSGWNLSTTVWPKETACCQRHTKPPLLGCHHCPPHLHSLPSLIKVLTSFSPI